MTLREARCQFTLSLATLIAWTSTRGYEVAIDQAKRCKDCPIGHEKSLHKIGLAVDLLLYRDGEYLTETSDYVELGEFWEELGYAWGGRWGDGDHFSLPWEGMK